MMDRSPFRLVLISTSSVNEYDNTNSNFKNRLPTPIRLEGEWQVALDDISLPGASGYTDRLTNRWYKNMMKHIYEVRPRDSSSGIKTYTWHFDSDDLAALTPTLDGVGLMKSMINKMEQFRIQETAGETYTRFFVKNPVDNKQYDTYWKFKFEGDELVTDNAAIYPYGTDRKPILLISIPFALKMGWIAYDPAGGDSYILGPNLKQELFDPSLVPTLNGSPTGDVYDARTDVQKFVFWTCDDSLYGKSGIQSDNNYLRLSYHCNWRFTNLNAAFKETVGSTNRTLLVYSDVCAPSTVGSQKVDLLREVTYEDHKEGTTYFEPHRLQHLQVRNQTLDVINIQIAEKDGRIASFQPGPTTVTLHFRPV